MIRFGKHCSVRKGLVGALDEAHLLGCEAVQIFTRSPRMWKMSPLSAADARIFVRRRRELGIRPLVVHTPYLPNLASSQNKLYAISVASLKEDLKICEKIAADYFVIHPGSYSLDAAPELGIANIVRAVNASLTAVPGATRILFENVAGGGRRLGSTFADLARMIKGIRQKKRIGVCLDTAHALGAGYDLSTPAGIDAMLKEFAEQIGLDRLFIMHCNDSLVPRGSHKDRHQSLGKGYVGKRGFKYLIGRLKHRVAAGILETPKDTPGADARNLSLLFKWRDAPGLRG
jgi:deoxyribonuclease-4